VEKTPPKLPKAARDKLSCFKKMPETANDECNSGEEDDTEADEEYSLINPSMKKRKSNNFSIFNGEA